MFAYYMYLEFKRQNSVCFAIQKTLLRKWTAYIKGIAKLVC